MKNICHERTINDYNEINHVSSESKDDVLKRRTSNNKSDGTFDNTEKCALNFEIDKEKNTDINVEDVSRVNKNTSNNMHVEENDALLDIFNNDIFLEVGITKSERKQQKVRNY